MVASWGEIKTCAERRQNWLEVCCWGEAVNEKPVSAAAASWPYIHYPETDVFMESSASGWDLDHWTMIARLVVNDITQGNINLNKCRWWWTVAVCLCSLTFVLNQTAHVHTLTAGWEMNLSSVCILSLQLESLNQSELASRLTLNCQNSYVEPHKIKDVAVTIIDVSISPDSTHLCSYSRHLTSFVFGAEVFDQSALSPEAKEEMYKLYPNARRAHLKTGGNFPYLCRSAEVNLYIQVRSGSRQVPQCCGFGSLGCNVSFTYNKTG